MTKSNKIIVYDIKDKYKEKVLFSTSVGDQMKVLGFNSDFDFMVYKMGDMLSIKDIKDSNINLDSFVLKGSIVLMKVFVCEQTLYFIDNDMKLFECVVSKNPKLIFNFKNLL